MNGNKVCPTSTVLPARIRLYQATQRPRHLNGDWIETAWGRCRVSGRLGQRHADLIEAILFHAEKRRDCDDGGIELLVDPARVRKSISDGRYSLEQIWKLIGEARTVNIEMQATDFSALGGLLDHVKKTKLTRHNPLGGERQLWTVRLGMVFCELLRRDLPLNYDPANVSRLGHGISQAIARHVLTHKTAPCGGWKLDTLIQAVAGALGEQAMRDRRREVKEDRDLLAEMGIVLTDDVRIIRG